MRKRRLRLLLAVLLLSVFIGPAAAGADDSALFPFRQNGLWGYMDRQGRAVIAPQWAYARPFSGNMALVGMKRLSPSQWTLYGHADGVIDQSGHYLVAPKECLNIEEYPFAYRLRDPLHEDREGFLDKESGFLQMPRDEYTAVFLWGEDGKGPIAIMNNKGMTGYIDRSTGKTAIPFRYDGESEEPEFQNGYALPASQLILSNKSGEADYLGVLFHLIDRSGHEIKMPEGLFPFSRVRNGAFVFAEKSDLKDQEDGSFFLDGYGLAKPDGTVLIPRDRDIMLMYPPDENGMVCFLKKTKNGLRCGHMDVTGRVIVPPRYHIEKEYYDTYAFKNGYAVIKDSSVGDGNRWVIIDPLGQEVFTAPGRTEDGYYFALEEYAVQKNGLIWYSTWKPKKKACGVVEKAEQRYGLLRIADGRAEYLTEPIYEDNVGFSLAADDIFRIAPNFAEGLQPVRRHGLWGYINEKAEWVIRPAWHEAADFRNGLALVQKDGRLAYIDHEGVVVWREKE